MQHTVDLDQEYEITAPVDYFGMKLRETIGTVFAPSSREALRLARQEFGKNLGKLTARLTNNDE